MIVDEVKARILSEKFTHIRLYDIAKNSDDEDAIQGLDLVLHGKITIMNGNSGTGKTYVIDTLRELKQVPGMTDKYPILNDILLIDVDAEVREFIGQVEKGELTDKIIMVDEADVKGMLTDKRLKSVIENDLANVYLLMLRGSSLTKAYGTCLGTTPANICELSIGEDKIARLRYKYDMGGW